MLPSSPSTGMASVIPPGHELSSVSANIQRTFDLVFSIGVLFFSSNMVMEGNLGVLGRMGRRLGP